jgi:hypothetical protein
MFLSSFRLNMPPNSKRPRDMVVMLSGAKHLTN